MAYATIQGNSSSSVLPRVVRGGHILLWCVAWTFLAAPSLQGQTSDPPLEPIPMPAPMAKAQQPQEPTPARRLAPANYQDSRSQGIANPTEVIVETPAAQAPPASADGQVTQAPVTRGPMFQLDPQPGERVIGEPIPRNSQQIAPAPGGMIPPGPPAAAVITEQATTAHAYYVAPSIQVYLPRSRAAYRRTYYAADVQALPGEVPAARVTVLRAPSINLRLGAPPAMPAGFLAAGPLAPPPEAGVVVAPGVVEVGPPPFVPGQPVRNAFRAMMW